MFGVLLSALIDLGMYWDWARTWQFLTFCIAAPGIALAINLSSVRIYGLVESIARVVKLILVLGAIITMLVVNTRSLDGRPKNGLKYISDGFKSDSRVTTSPFVATL
ncbi:hypothetical protein BJ875DRAFT_547299 [Amylocarpus encephaloides]|uniref:Uncharacterized protein n=1 Tax=Amylocarpus encephaloides TaxID=45428 RepID=A0A9P7Y8J3_9HELO|nr:hypothetical protein BJ875DRAFT_547299 [Amylocarpus encephaloides]